MTPEQAKWMAFGILIGWITKFPLLWKWYRELKQTRDYREAMRLKNIKRLEEIIANRKKENGISQLS